jgi:hypothetical protein
MSDVVDEAKKLLLSEVHECSHCRRWATEYETNPVTYGEDPYAAEIADDHTEIWECDNCREQSAMDI